MMKKLVVLLACFGLVANLSACSLFSKDSTAGEEVTSDFDSADLEKLEGDQALDAGVEGADGAVASSDQLPEDALGETQPDMAAAPPAEAPAEPQVAELPADPFAPQPDAPAADAPMDTAASSVPEPTMPDTASTMSEPTSSGSTTYVDEPSEPAPKKAATPLQKVATAPWQVGKTWYNTVYFARPGDTLKSISTMIYGNGKKVGELKKGNPTIASRGVKPGDKVYYNSPHRSDDSGRLITYYEDNGVQPEVYTAKEGDNIRAVSKELLGYDGAWKEVWASNSVESKQEIPAGTQLQYWKGGQVAAAPAQQEVAAAPAAEMPPMPEAPAMPDAPPQQAAADIPPPPTDMAAPPAPDMQAPPPPPEMPQEMAPPPPPPPMPAMNPPTPPQQDEVAGTGAMDNDTTMALGVVGLAAAGLAILIVMRKKRRQRELEQQSMDNTHVGT
ncbi:LysM peptidoglycan-binding domain-containing protein [Bdellovibrio sp. HCB290]|uniref:LysM peptidoglycan-binding domain-containing protein n=1 Tax=Bdellovibrio sp. HCB290 TaxID=3394356 RepID=UPI0039B5A58A